MVRRTAKRGANSGNEFWGCSQYPGCKGTRPAWSGARDRHHPKTKLNLFAKLTSDMRL